MSPALSRIHPARREADRWGSTLRSVEDRLPPDPVKLLSSWMEWEKGETPPGRVISNLKLGGMKELLEAAAEQARLALELESY